MGRLIIFPTFGLVMRTDRVIPSLQVRVITVPFDKNVLSDFRTIIYTNYGFVVFPCLGFFPFGHVHFVIDFTTYRKSLCSGGTANVPANYFEVLQWFSAPGVCNMWPCPMFDQIVHAGSRRIMTDRDFNPKLITQLLKCNLEQVPAGSIASATIRKNE